MIFFIALLLFGLAVWGAFVVGCSTADRRTDVNHHRLAMFAASLRARDDLVPFLSSEERGKLDDLIRDYTRLDAEIES